MVSDDLIGEIIAAISTVPELGPDPAHIMPHVPDRVLPVQEIHELLRDWMEKVEAWGELLSDADACHRRLAQLPSMPANRRVVGL